MGVNTTAGEMVSPGRALVTAEHEERCCDANASIEAALRIAKERARGVASFMVEAPAPVPLAINGGRMVQVLVSLLVNAVDAIGADPHRRGAGTVWIQLSRRRLVIADDGPRRAKGGGADLALCRQYLSESGFSLSADARPGGGSRVTVIFN